MMLSRFKPQPSGILLNSNILLNACLVGVLLLALALRLYHLGSPSLWLDEGYSLAAARHLNPFDAQRPLYFWLLNGWMRFGHSEAWLRLPSVVFGVAAVGLLFLIGAQIASRPVALLSSLFYALSPSQIFHAQEVRMYSLAPMLLLAAVYTLLLWAKTRRALLLLLHAALASLSLFTLPLTAAGLGMTAAALMWRLRREKRDALRLMAAYGVVALCWLPFLQQSVSHPEGLAWIKKPHMADLLGLHSWAFIGRRLELSPAPVTHGQWAQTALIAGLALVVVWLAAFAVQDGRGLTTERFVALWFYVVVAAVFVISITLKPLWVERYFTPFLPALFLLTALGVRRLWTGGKRRLLAGAAAVGLVAAQAFFTARTFAVAPQGREDWRGVGQFVGDRAQPDDTVVLAGAVNRDTGVLWHYYCPRADLFLSPITVPLLPAGSSPAAREGVTTQTAKCVSPALAQGRAVWLVVREAAPNGNDAPAQISALLPRLGNRVVIQQAAFVEFHIYRIACR